MYRVLVCTLFEHNPWLVALAAILCAGAFAVTGAIWLRLPAVSKRWRVAWLLAMGAVTGGGIWATHFVAMLAYTPPTQVGFDFAVTLASLLIGICATSAAFALFQLSKRMSTAVLSGGVFAIGVIALHFVGMAGLEAAADKVWRADTIVAAWLMCSALSIGGMAIARHDTTVRGRIWSCVLLAGAVVSLHFTAMGALTLAPNPTMPPIEAGLDPLSLATLIALTATATLCVIAVLIIVDHRVTVAESKSAAKSEFLASMSHELRTPLTSIISYAELMAETAAEDGRKDDQQDALIIIGASRHLLSLISEILDFSKLEAGQLKIESAPFATADLLSDVTIAAAPLVAANHNAFERAFASDLGAMHTDRLRLRQCLLNLLSNAAKFTTDGVVTLGARPEQRQGRPGIRFDVTDTGIGIKASILEHIFHPFAQADETIARRFGGTGLGLSITKRLAETLGGGIHVESKIGLGSTFSIWAPVTFIPKPTAQIRGAA